MRRISLAKKKLGLNNRLFTSESVGAGHPDKVADQISDAVLDSIIAVDPVARVACETLVTTGLVVLAGEVTVHNQAASDALSRAEDTARETIREIGYVDPTTGFDYRSCAVIRSIHSQSADINQGVDRKKGVAKVQGAGDQGLMFGYACRETPELMPLPIHLSHRLVEQLAKVRENGRIKWLRPDCKSQVTVEYDDSGRPRRIHTVVLSTQHDESACQPRNGNLSKKAANELKEKVILPILPKRLVDSKTIYHVNPTGRFVIGGPHGDAGLTGRKIIVDTYGGRGRHGGGAFSGKDPSKVDRSACYMARYIAKNIVAAKLADDCEVQLSYAIGVAEPISVLVTAKGAAIDETALAKLVRDHFPLRPGEIISHLKLLRPIYRETARYGHFGRSGYSWEKTDKAAALAKAARKYGAI
jgi:S-adenosylmethionine synthetase